MWARVLVAGCGSVAVALRSLAHSEAKVGKVLDLRGKRAQERKRIAELCDVETASNTFYVPPTADNPSHTYILGVLHGNAECRRQTKLLIEKLKPNTVVVEASPSMTERMKTRLETGRDPGKDLSIVELWKMGYRQTAMTELLFGVYCFLNPMRLKKKSQMDNYTNGEMMDAIQAAKAIGARVVGADNDWYVRSERLFKAVAWQDITLLHKIGMRMRTVTSRTHLSAEEIELQEKYGEASYKSRERLFERDSKKSMIGGGLFCHLANAHERDLLISKTAREAPGDVVVAVVGLSHIAGVLDFWEEQPGVDYDALRTPDGGSKEALESWLTVHPMPPFSVFSRIKIGTTENGFKKPTKYGLCNDAPRNTPKYVQRQTKSS